YFAHLRVRHVHVKPGFADSPRLCMRNLYRFIQRQDDWWGGAGGGLLCPGVRRKRDGDEECYGEQEFPLDHEFGASGARIPSKRMVVRRSAWVSGTRRVSSCSPPRRAAMQACN